MTRLLTWFLAALSVSLAACGPRHSPERPPPREQADRLAVAAVSYPLTFFAERIGGELVDVRFPVPADEDPAYWDPTAEEIASYQAADLILLNGAGYARWVDRASLPVWKLVDTSAGFSDRLISLDGAVSHSHGPEGAHEHVGWAHTTWLDAALAAEHARAVSEALKRARPEHAAELEDRFTILESALLTLDVRLAAASDRIADAPLVFSHPVYQYLERRYHLDGESLHWEPDEAPEIAELERLLARHPARFMVWEVPPSPRTVAALETIGVASVVFDPCANRPATGDFLSVMDENAGALETIAAGLARP